VHGNEGMERVSMRPVYKLYGRDHIDVANQRSSCRFSMAKLADFLLVLASTSISACQILLDPPAIILNHMANDIDLIWLVIL
jgi:hypothetical protein